MTKYYKLTNKEENHNGFQYQDGLNTDHLPFNETGTCCPGGLYFSDAENILLFLLYTGMYWIREVTPDTKNMVQDPDNDLIKWRSKSLDCQPRKSLMDINTWIWMKEQDIINENVKDYVLKWSSEKGHLHGLKFLLKTFDNQFSYNIALKCSSRYGHIEVVKYLVEIFHNKFSQSSINHAFMYSSENGHLEVVKLLTEKFYNQLEQRYIAYAFRWSVLYPSVTKFIEEKFNDILTK